MCLKIADFLKKHYICTDLSTSKVRHYENSKFYRVEEKPTLIPGRGNKRHRHDGVINDTDTVVISRENGTAAVIISMDEYNAIKETEYIMQSPATMEAIRRASDELDRGESVRQEDGESVEDFLARI